MWIIGVINWCTLTSVHGFYFQSTRNAFSSSMLNPYHQKTPSKVYLLLCPFENIKHLVYEIIFGSQNELYLKAKFWQYEKRHKCGSVVSLGSAMNTKISKHAFK